MRLATLLCLIALPAAADPFVDRVVDTVALPRFDAFASAAGALAEAAQDDCSATGPALRQAWNDAFDAFLPAQAFRSGPMEDRGIGIAYWPDPKGFTEKNLIALLAANGPDLASAETYSGVSVAARGLYALEVMLFDPDFKTYGPEDPGCALVGAATADLALTARAASAAWALDYAPLLRSAGEPANTRFLTTQEVRQSLFTQLLTQLEFDKDERLGRPLGSLEKPRPTRAESRASGRSLRNIRVSLAANEDLARALGADQTEGVLPAFAYARSVADKLTDPTLADVGTPGGRFRVQELADAIGRVAETSSAELGAVLGVAPGFNALDGD